MAKKLIVKWNPLQFGKSDFGEMFSSLPLPSFVLEIGLITQARVSMRVSWTYEIPFCAHAFSISITRNKENPNCEERKKEDRNQIKICSEKGCEKHGVWNEKREHTYQIE